MNVGVTYPPRTNMQSGFMLHSDATKTAVLGGALCTTLYDHYISLHCTRRRRIGTQGGVSRSHSVTGQAHSPIRLHFKTCASVQCGWIQASGFSLSYELSFHLSPSIPIKYAPDVAPKYNATGDRDTKFAGTLAT